MKKYMMGIVALVVGLIVGAGSFYVATNNNTDKVSTVESVLKNGQYTVSGEGFKSATVNDGWLTMKNNKNVTSKYFMVEANRKDNDIIVLQREKTGVSYMYKVDVKKDKTEFKMVKDGKPQDIKFTFEKA